MLPLRQILHPTDFSESAHAAFALASSLARDYGARLLVLYVLPPPLFHGEVVARREATGYYDDLWQQLHELQPSDPSVVVDYFLEEGDPATLIVRVAQEQQCDLIVMGTHARGGLGRLLLGSVAEAVVRKAPCPVLTVKTPLAHTTPARARRRERVAM